MFSNNCGSECLPSTIFSKEKLFKDTLSSTEMWWWVSKQQNKLNLDNGGLKLIKISKVSLN